MTKLRYAAWCLLLLAAACSGNSAPTLSAPLPTTQAPAETAARLPATIGPEIILPVDGTPGTPLPTRLPSPTAAPLRVENGNFWLEITQPADEAVFNWPEVLVTGRTVPGAVVSINDEIILVGKDGAFSATLALEEGPNPIEIVASNAEGEELSIVMNVYFEIL